MIEEFEENVEQSYMPVSYLPDFLYEEIKEKSIGLLVSYGGRAVPVDVFGLAAHLGVKLVKYSELDGFEREKLTNENAVLSDGFLTVVEDEGNRILYIFYNDSRDRRRIRFTILHEIGHFVFGHCQHSDLAEAMANFFAKYMIAPPPLILMYQVEDYVELARIFDISLECARYSFHYYRQWLKRVEGKKSFENYELKLIVFGCVCCREELNGF